MSKKRTQAPGEQRIMLRVPVFAFDVPVVSGMGLKYWKGEAFITDIHFHCKLL